MNIQELAQQIGTRGLIDLGTAEPMLVAVEIVNVKVAYGRPRYMVRPVEGQGANWVEAHRVRPLAEAGVSRG